VKTTAGLLSLFVITALGVAGCPTDNAFDTPLTTDGKVTLKTYGDMGTATARARLACGEPKRTPVLMSTRGTGEDQVATFGCL
jgi:hypothetical protein